MKTEKEVIEEMQKVCEQMVADDTARNRLFQMEASAFGVVRSSL